MTRRAVPLLVPMTIMGSEQSVKGANAMYKHVTFVSAIGLILLAGCSPEASQPEPAEEADQSAAVEVAVEPIPTPTTDPCPTEVILTPLRELEASYNSFPLDGQVWDMEPARDELAALDVPECLAETKEAVLDCYSVAIRKKEAEAYYEASEVPPACSSAAALVEERLTELGEAPVPVQPIDEQVAGPEAVTSIEDMVGTWHAIKGSSGYMIYRADGTFAYALELENLEDEPSFEGDYWFEEGQFFVRRTTPGGHPISCEDQEIVGVYGVGLLPNGNHKFTLVEDQCEGRADYFQGAPDLESKVEFTPAS